MHRSLTILMLFTALLQYQNCMTTVKLTNAVCESFNKSWATIELCRLKAISRNLTIFLLNGTILHPTPTLRLSFEIQKKANGYKPWLVKHSFDVCANMLRASHPISKVVLEALKKKTSVDHPCPFGGFFYSKKNMHFSAADLRLPLPTGQYLMLLTFCFNANPTFIVKLYFDYLEDIVKQ